MSQNSDPSSSPRPAFSNPLRRRPRRDKTPNPNPMRYYTLAETLNMFDAGQVFTVFDIEHTGSQRQSIVELGAIQYGLNLRSKKDTPTFHRLVKTDPKVIPWQVRKKIRIPSEDLLNGCDLKETLEEFMAFLKGTVPVCHSAADDFRTINKNLTAYRFTPLERLSVCIQKFAKEDFGMARLSLEALVEQFNVKQRYAHRAMFDALSTRDILHRMICRQKASSNAEAPSLSLDDLPDDQPQTPLPR